MARLFRIARWQLLRNSNVKMYLLYALGEIVLVVVGILIALQLNNQNELRKNSEKEHLILTSLSKDFASNVIVLDSSIINNPNIIKRLENNINYIGLDQEQLSNEMKDTILTITHIHTNIINGTLSSILNTEKLELIKNETLKTLLTAYPAHLEQFYDMQSKLEYVIMHRQRPILEKHLSLADHLPTDDSRFNTIKSKGVKSDYSSLLSSLAYQNALIDRMNMEDKLVTRAKLLRSQSIKILNVLNQELGKDYEITSS